MGTGGRARTLARAATTVARDRLGVDIRRVPRPSAAATPGSAAPATKPAVTKSTVLYEVDEQFQAVYADAAARSGGGQISQARMYNLVQALAFTRGVDGLVAECGVYRGFSSYVLCRYLGLEDPAFTGAGFHAFDSFEGLSDLAPPDRAGDAAIPGPPREAGLFKGSLDDVRHTLADFPDVAYHQGWIPAVFDGTPEGPFRLVHVDVDLHDPTRDALAWFHPRLAPGGMMVVDDYGSIRWPGARAAVDRFGADHGVPVLPLSSAQALLFGPGR